MNRVIKFRAWDIEDKQMIYPLISDLATINHKKFVIQKEKFGPVRTIELMQFTGLTDRNGKEIYEGDILAISGRRDVMLQAVTFDEGFYCTDEFALFELTRDKNWSIEVIGNIYEHPHLLEGVK